MWGSPWWAGCRWRPGDAAGRRAGVHPVLAAVHPAAAQLGSMANLLQSGVASAERVFELLDTEEQSPDPVPAQAPDGGRGRLVFENVSFAYSPDKPLISDLSLVAEPGQTVRDRGPDRGGQDHAGEPDDALLRARRRADHAGRRGRGRDVPARAALADGHGAAGHLAVRRDHPGQHRLRPPDASEAEILEAARATYVDRFVKSLPQGYDTVLDDEVPTSRRGRSSC